MFKSGIVFLATIVVLAAGNGDRANGINRRIIHEECRKEFGREVTRPCLIACYMKECGLLRDGEYDVEAAIAMVDNWSSLVPPVLRRRVRHDAGDEIISKKSLLAVKESISFLKQHAREEGLFRRAGRRQLRRQILGALTRGEKPQLDNVDGAALECAAALQLFLGRLKRPVMPQHVQQLILADNPGVSAHIVARDALGLIRQDVRGRHGELLADLLGLLRHLTLAAPPSECSELQGSPLPVALLPVFFTLTPADLIKWRQVAARFSELITEAPQQLQLSANPSESRETTDSSESQPLGHAGREESEQFTRLRELSLLYPIIRLADDHNACQVGEMARVLAAPLHRPPAASRLHPAITHSNR